MKCIGEIIALHARRLGVIVYKKSPYTFRGQRFFDRRLYSLPGFMDVVFVCRDAESTDSCLRKASEVICSWFKIQQLIVLLREDSEESSRLVVRLVKNFSFPETFEKGSHSFLIECFEHLSKPLLIKELLTSLPGDPIVVDLQAMGVNLVVPMFQQRKLFGLLILGERTIANSFSREEVDQLNRIASLLVTVLENVKLRKLTEELEVTNRDLKIRVLDLHNLFDVSREVCHGLDLSHILNSFLLAVMGQLRVNSASLLVKENETSNFRVGYSKGIDKEKIAEILIPHQEEMGEELIFDNQPIIISQIPDDGRLYRWKKMISFLDGKVFLPLRTKGGMLAILVLGAKIDDSAFGQSDLKILSVLGNELSAALENAQLYQNLAKKNEELQRAYEELWKIQQLLLLSNRLTALGELAGKIAHEINKPLTGILGFTQHMLASKQGKINDRDYLQLIEKECLRCQETINRILDFARQPVSKISSVDIKDILEECLLLTRYYPGFQKVRIFKEYDLRLPLIQADGDKLKQVFLNLIINASQAMPSGGKLKISVEVIPENILEIKIADDGRGIPPEYIDHIFDPFFTTKTEVKGNGLGLFISQAIIREHEGTIEVESKPDEGTTFSIRLPIKFKEVS